MLRHLLFIVLLSSFAVFASGFANSVAEARIWKSPVWETTTNSKKEAVKPVRRAVRSIKTASGQVIPLLNGMHTVILHTTKGDITLKLNATKTPLAVTNFIGLAKKGYYDGLTFHRVISGFMIQGGDPTGEGQGGESLYGKPFQDEKSRKIVRGIIGMANRGPNTNGSQFFILQGKEAPWLDGMYTVFGVVTKGMDVVDEIAHVSTDPKNDRPKEAVTFTVEVVQ